MMDINNKLKLIFKTCKFLILIFLFPCDAYAESKDVSDCNNKILVNRTITVFPKVKLYKNRQGEAILSNISWKTQLKMFGDLNEKRILVQTITSKQCGYVYRNKILLNREAKTVSDLNSKEEIKLKDGRIIKNKWKIKAMIRSNKDDDAQSAWLYNYPNGKHYRRTRVFGLYSVYTVFKDENSKQSEWWYYIAGEDPLETNVLSGWIQRKNLFFWDSAVSVYYGAPGEPFNLYKSPQHMRSSSDKGIIAKRYSTNRPRQTDFPKFPILSSIYNSSNGDEDSRKIIGYKIAYFGAACPQGGCIKKQGSDNKKSQMLTGEEVGIELGKIGQLVKDSKNIDILFLIDNTESMTKYFKPIANAVSSWSNMLHKHFTDKAIDGEIRFGAAIYGDYNDASNISVNNFDYTKLTRFRSDASSFKKIFKDISPFNDDLNDPPEAGFAALYKSLNDFEWSPNAAYKVIVWITDQGVRKKGDKEILSADILRPYFEDKGVALSTIFVSSKKSDITQLKKNVNNLLQKKLSLENRKMFGTNIVSTGLVKTDKKTKSDPQRAAFAVKSILSSIFNASNSLIAEILSERGESPNSTTLANKTNNNLLPVDLPILQLIDVSDITHGVIRQKGFDSKKDIKKILKLNQEMGVGYLKYKGSLSKSRSFYATVQPETLSIFLVPVFHQTCKTMSKGGDIGKKLHQSLVNLTYGLSGDQYTPPETVSSYLERLLFIPKNSFASWLDKEPNDIYTYWENANDKEREKIRLSVCQTAYLLQQMEAGRRVKSRNSLIWDNPSTGKLKLRNDNDEKEFHWLWSTESGFSFYYIPIEYFPQDP